MRVKKKRKGKDTTGPKKAEFVHRPFESLRRALADNPEPATALPPLQASEPDSDEDVEEPLDDGALLDALLSDVEPIAGDTQRVSRPAAPRPMLPCQDDDALVMKELDDLVSGETEFDFADTDEYIEACAAGLDRRVLRKLKRGEFAVQDHLDLHGYNREQARQKVAIFIRKCHAESKRCVVIVHGRGLGSKDNIPVLKVKLASWLTRGAIGKRVLAFTSARPHDGGTGAVYVLLRS